MRTVNQIDSLPVMGRRDLLRAAVALAITPSFARAQSDPIADLVAQVDPARLQQTVFEMAAFPTRWTNHPDFGAVEAWMLNAFGDAGVPQPFEMPNGKQRHNIVAGNPLSGREIVLIGAHYDAISETPAVTAPGANDNATGVAAMLEVHRILAALDTPREVVCVAFAGEEQGLHGSTACARIAAEAGWPIALMLNLDMLGWRPPTAQTPMIVEYDQGNAVPSNDAAARTFGLRAAELAGIHTALNIAHTNIWSSDYMPFEARGFPAIGLYDGGADEGAVGGHYHTVSDTPDNVDYGRLTEAARLAVAIVADAIS